MITGDTNRVGDGNAFHRLVPDSQLILGSDVKQLDPDVRIATPEFEDRGLARPVSPSREGGDNGPSVRHALVKAAGRVCFQRLRQLRPLRIDKGGRAAGDSERTTALRAQIATTGTTTTHNAKISDVALLFDIPVTSQVGAIFLGGTVGGSAQ